MDLFRRCCDCEQVLEVFSALRNCKSICRIRSTAPQRCEAKCCSVHQMHMNPAILNHELSCSCPSENGMLGTWPPSISPCFLPLGFVAALFTPAWISMASLTFLSVRFEGKGWWDVLYGPGLDCAAGTVSVGAISFLPLLQWHEHNLFPLDAPATSHINEQACLSQGQCCILGEQPWMGLAWIASLGRSGVNSNTAVWLGLETSIDFGDKCSGQLCSHVQEAGYLCVGVHDGFHFIRFAICWPLLT